MLFFFRTVEMKSTVRQLNTAACFRSTLCLRFENPYAPANRQYTFNEAKSSVENSDKVIRFFFGEKGRTHPREPFPGLWLPQIEGQPLEEALRVFNKDLTLAKNGEYNDWAQGPWGCLAVVILLSRLGRSKYLHDNTENNMARSEGYKVCAQAIPFSRQALRRDEWLRDQYRTVHMEFLLDPLFRSENIDDVDECISQYQKLGFTIQLLRERRSVLQQFGRFPSRNASLGRETTDEEFEWMCSGNTVPE